MTLSNRPSQTESSVAKDVRARNTFRVAVVMVGAALATALFYLILAIQNNAWQLFVASASIWVFALVVIVSAVWARRGRASQAASLLIGSMLIAIQFSSGTLAHMGLPLGFATGIAAIVMATLTLPQRRIGLGIAIAIAASVLSAFLDLYGSIDQLELPIISAAAPYIMGTTLVVFGLLVIRQFPSYTLRNKLIVVLLFVALIPLGAQALLNDLNTRETLTNAASQTLSSAAQRVASDIDGFIVRVQDSMAVYAIAPQLSEYLRLPAGQQQESVLRDEIALSFEIFRNRDPIYLLDVSLMNREGQVVVTTLAPIAGQDLSDQDFFTFPMQSNQPYVSPVEFLSLADEAYLHFGMPVQNLVGQPIGVLWVRYDAVVLQDIVARANGQVGDQSFAVLFDEYHIHLAHGTTPETIAKTVAPLTPQLTADLKAAKRLPDLSNDELFLDIPALEQSLTNAAQQPYFESEDVATGERINQVAVALLETQPWLVAFFQPREVFMAPVDVQTRGTLLAGLFIAGLVTVVAVGSASLLARPIVQLTQAADRVAGGDLNAQAVVETSDEIGALASAFNSMTNQLRGLVGSLESQVASRTAQLRASADVGRAAVSMLDTNRLLREVVNLITDRFGFYYAAVFTLDELGQYAVLREATGEAGRVLKQRGHKLEVGGKSMVGSAIALRRSRIALDVGKEAVRFANPLLPETRSEIALPLMVSDRVVGALDVQSTQSAAFDEASAATLQAMADQIAVALNNAELFRRVEAQAKSQRGLLNAALELSGRLDREALIDLIAHRAMDLFGADNAEIWLPVSDEEIELVKSASADETRVTGRRLARGQGLSGKVYASGLTLRVDDYMTWSSRAAAVEEATFHAGLGVPMLWQGRPTGVLLITLSQTDARFTAGDEHIAQLFAAQAAAALADAELREQQRRTLEELDAANRRLTGEAWAQYFYRLPGGVQQAAFAQPGHKPVEGVWLPEVDLTVAEMKPITWSKRHDQTIPSPFQAAMAAPIVLRGEVIGALQVGEADRSRPWSEDDLAFLQAVAEQVAQAVDNVRLVDQTQRAAFREKAVAEAADRIHRPIDLDAILRNAVEEVSRITGSSDVSIQIGMGAVPIRDEGNGHRLDRDGDGSSVQAAKDVT